MTKKSNKRITSRTLRRRMENRLARRLYNEQYNGKYRGEVEFMETVLSDVDFGGWQNREHGQDRQSAASCIMPLDGRSDTKTGERGDGCRPVVGAMSNPSTPSLLTGGGAKYRYPSTRTSPKRRSPYETQSRRL